MSVKTCDIVDGNVTHGVTARLEKLITSRKKAYPGQSDSDRWRDIYRLIFPDQVVPSPCRYPLHSITI